MKRQLEQRWDSADGRPLADAALAYLAGASHGLPEGVGTHDGLVDLRGPSVPTPWLGQALHGGGTSAQLAEGLLDFQQVAWRGLDLSYSYLPGLRFTSSEIEGCRFENADCQDWRLWNTNVQDCTFVAANLRDAAVGTWHQGSRNAWRRVRFDGADLSEVLALGCVLEECSFDRARLTGAQFQQATIAHCRFAGPMRHVLFDGRDISGRPPADVMRNVDFAEATFEDVEFRGRRFDQVALPHAVYAVPAFPEVARRVIQLLDGQHTVEARMLRADLDNVLRLPGREDSIGVFNRRDYVASGGGRLADLAQSLLMEAADPPR